MEIAIYNKMQILSILVKSLLSFLYQNIFLHYCQSLVLTPPEEDYTLY